jgi:PadR family transcriptional regulator PadR
MEPLHGLLEMLVLRTLIFGPLHGYGIAKSIQTRSNDSIEIEFGSLYPALKRLEHKGWIVSKWGISEQNRRAKYYRLTPAGKKQLQQEHSEWREFASAIAQVMWTAPEEGQS